MNILMLSSSRRGDEDYLQSAKGMIKPQLSQCSSVLFIPYAGVTVGWDDYTSQVQQALPDWQIQLIHHAADPKEAIASAQAIMVGGGNTFNLLHQLYEHDLLYPIFNAVQGGTPYVGWSAGSNICGATICTTNDMPIVQPKSFTSLNLVPFQLNPHYSDYQPPGFNGETRAQRIAEFCALQPNTSVVGIREGSALLKEGDKLTLVGDLQGVRFIGQSQEIIEPGQDLSFLL